ncbi:MAG: 4Fe-4S binding protein [Bacteroidales bacterium]|nr:4Fe-4S binding protein [Bacteroidales bacterium]
MTFSLLSLVQIMVENPMILAERFLKGAGWIEIVFISLYGAYVTGKMTDPGQAPRWRIITWTIFSAVFFLQLIIGIAGYEKFLMTGKLHLPVPMMILGGPLYRGEVSFMTILFLSTVVLSGPAWCSQLCYFGAIDNLASSGKTSRNPIRGKMALKSTFLIIVISAVLILRWFNVPPTATTLIAVSFGVAGLGIMVIFSRRKKKMVHCVLYCPVGTLVNLFRHVNPFRMYIDHSCTLCLQCTKHCKYDALNKQDIYNKKPGFTCTMCGDCLAGCKHNSIKYKFLRLKPDASRNLYIIITITLHSVFLALARI